MSRQFDVVVERDSEGYFVASVPDEGGLHELVFRGLLEQLQLRHAVLAPGYRSPDQQRLEAASD